MSKQISISVLALFLLLTNINSQWVKTGGPFSRYINALHANNNTIYAGGYAGMRKSTNDGANWTVINTGLTNIFVWAITTHNSNLYAGTLNGVFRSTDDGASWVQKTSGITSIYIYALHKRGPYVFAGAYGGGSYDGGVFRTTNNGDNWTSLFGNGLTNENCYAVTTKDTILFAGTLGGVFRSYNNGDTWTAVNTGILDQNIRCLTVIGNTIFAGSGTIGFGAVYVSTNNGDSWTATYSGITTRDIRAFAVSGTNLFAGTGGGGVFLSTNNGTNWAAVNTGLNLLGVYGLTINNNFLYAGTYDSGYVYKRQLSEMVSAENNSSILPNKFELNQNYPNPFNPASLINYSIPKAGHVSLNVYDVSGRLIKKLIDENKAAGNFSITFDGTDLPSGIYFYELKSGEFRETKKMILVK